MAELLTDEERRALSQAVVNAVDADGHKAGLCFHCGTIKQLGTWLMGDRERLYRLVTLRHERTRLLAEECRT